MQLAAGTRLGQYEVLAKLGEGGMGEVYRARDMKLERDVALKVLPQAFSTDRDRVARLEREAKTLASLNHPNIAHVYDAGSGDAGAYLVMELVEGQDLSQRIAGGAVTVADALPIGRQIALALEAAHEAGIIHRDLKPANIKVREDGTVKVLDFGLAKVLDPDRPDSASAMNSPTLTARATEMGLILGTAAYMAPEQAKGKSVDKRADVWAFGVVLYEMLTGRRAFAGDDVSETLAAVLRDVPSIGALSADVPPSIRRLLRRCLEKDRTRRLDSMAAARLEIDDAIAGEAAELSGRASPAAPPARGGWRFAAAALALAAVAATAGWFLRPQPAAPTNTVGRFSYGLPEGVDFTRAGRQNIAISPDGTKIAFIAQNQIYLRRLGELEAQPIRGSNIDPADLVFSPDGESLAFFAPLAMGGDLATASLKRMAVAGGPVLTLCSPGAPFGIRWQGNRIIFSVGDSIQTVSDTGGTPETLVKTAKTGERLGHPQLVNDGRDVIYSVRQTGVQWDSAQIVMQAVGGGDRRVLVQAGSDGRLIRAGGVSYLVYIFDGTLFAQRMTESFQSIGGQIPMVEGVNYSGANTGVGKYAVSLDGTLAYQPGSSATMSDLAWIDRKGVVEIIGAPRMAYVYPRLSPDGSKIAVNVSNGDLDLFIWELQKKTMSKLTSGPAGDNTPLWTSDSRHLLYRSDESGQVDLYRRAVDGTGTPERLTDSIDAEWPFAILPDQKLVVSLTPPSKSYPLLNLLTLGNPTKTVPLISNSPVRQFNADISPDGRWMAYSSLEGSALDEVHVRPFPNADTGHWQITSGGGNRPAWSKSGKELFFISQSDLYSVAVQTPPGGTSFVYGPATKVLDTTKFYFNNQIGRMFDVSHDGQRFLVVAKPNATTDARPSITIVTHWLDELRARVK